MRVLVLTVVHHPLDARVYTREIGALLAAGHEVTYAAPWSSFGLTPPDDVRAVDVPRAQRWRRLGAHLAARRVIRRLAATHDILILHNPELLLALPGTPRPVTVWDVHEDVRASLVDKTYLPRPLVAPLGQVVRAAERLAERHCHLLLAEEGYVPLFDRPHPVVPNEPTVPDQVAPPGPDRVVYLGRVSHGRGGAELAALGWRLPSGVTLEILGWAEPEIEVQLRAAADAGVLRWTGRVPNEEALARLRGATAGLSLLHDLPNYRHSRPTKVVEYMAQGVPVITTPSPVAVEIVERHRCGFVVPFGDVQAVADAVAALVADPDLRAELGANGHRAARQHYDWRRSGPRFVAQLEAWAASSET